MDTSTTYSEKEFESQKQLSPEFGSWPCDDEKIKAINETKQKFDDLLTCVKTHIPMGNGRYKAMVTTKLEEACMLAVKGISKPE